jgi:hypothetical protein
MRRDQVSHSLSSQATFSAVKLLTLFSHGPSPVHVRTLSKLLQRGLRDYVKSARRFCQTRKEVGLTESTRQSETSIGAADDHDVVCVFWRDIRYR